MYLQNELLMAVPLAVYVCLRIRSLIVPKVLKNLSTALFIILAAGYPVAESLSHGAGDGWKSAAILIGYDALPLMLYLVLTVVLADIAIGVLRLAKVLSKETVGSTRFRKRRLALVLTFPAIVVAYGIVNHNVLRVKEYRVEVPRRSSQSDGQTVVFMADLHFRQMTPNGILDQLVAKVNAQKPDIILIGGDILEGDRRDEDTGRYERAFRRMTSRYGIYGVPGNHERFRGAGTGDFFARAGIRLLQDEVETIDRAFVLAGRKDGRSRGRKSVDELLSAAPGELPVILLAHRPVELEQASRSGVDIQLSGHTHHGQLFPVNFVTAHEYELSWGTLRKGPTQVFVTSGVQVWGPPVRTVGASEILVIRVSFRGGE
jgi:predicted MPP superfamily phosphohydrolase